MPFTLAQVSDTHLDARATLFRSNFDRIATALDALRPDEIVATGDQALDGADSDADMVFAAATFSRLPVPVLAVPGNHDVGDHPACAPRQPVTTERLDRYRRSFGRDWWRRDRDGWRLLGLNSQVMGVHPDQDAQAAFVAEALDTLGGQRLAVFVHKPIFLADPDETAFSYWSVPPFARGPLRALMAHPALRLVASGHLHLHHEVPRGPVRYAWAPAVSFIVEPGKQAGLPGKRSCGVLVHEFDGDAVNTRLLQPDGMRCQYIHDVRDEGYPAPV